jgi:hypothetical protein
MFECQLFLQTVKERYFSVVVFQKVSSYLLKKCSAVCKMPELLIAALQPVVTGLPCRAGAIMGEALNSGYGTIAVGEKGLSDAKYFTMERVSNKVIQMDGEMAVWVVA